MRCDAMLSRPPLPPPPPQVHGPKYVGEMLRIDLEPYASLSGMDQALAARAELAQLDPLADALELVKQCVYAIPGVGNPDAVVTAREFLRIRRSMPDPSHEQPL